MLCIPDSHMVLFSFFPKVFDGCISFDLDYCECSRLLIHRRSSAGDTAELGIGYDLGIVAFMIRIFQ